MTESSTSSSTDDHAARVHSARNRPQLANTSARAAARLEREAALRRTLRAGVEAGALAGIVSGSGPTCAFLCADERAAVAVSAELAGAGVCRTVRVASGPVHGARVVGTSTP